MRRLPSGDYDMPTISIVSRKGGSGKSTLATNLAAYFALNAIAVTLGDLDHQQSMRVWLKRRPSAAPEIQGWVGDTAGIVRPPSGVANLVLDTPGGLTGLALAKVAMISDAIIIPVSGSVFDRESASDCWAELRAHPRVKSGKCVVACVGMRLDARTHAEEVTSDWAASVGLNFICTLRSTQLYVRAVENGLSIFDMPLSASVQDREQWRPIVAWLGETVFKPARVDEKVMAPKAFAPMNIATVTKSTVVNNAAKSIENEIAQGDSQQSQKLNALTRFIPSVFRRKN
jgi:chromosome partitioning protein